MEISDDQTGEPIALTDGSGNPLYAIYLEISPPRQSSNSYGQYGSPYWYDGGSGSEPMIMATLANYLSLPDVGRIQVQIPYTVMQTLRRSMTYNVYLRIEDVAGQDARQLLIGKLPIHFGGHGP